MSTAQAIYGRLRNWARNRQFSSTNGYPTSLEIYLSGRIDDFFSHLVITSGIYAFWVAKISFTLEMFCHFCWEVNDECEKVANFAAHGRVDDYLVGDDPALLKEKPIKFFDRLRSKIEKRHRWLDMVFIPLEGHLDCFYDCYQQVLEVQAHVFGLRWSPMWQMFIDFLVSLVAETCLVVFVCAVVVIDGIAHCLAPT